MLNSHSLGIAGRQPSAAICLARRQPYFLAGILTLGFHDESRSQVHDSHDIGAKTLPQECIRDDEHAGKQIKEAIQVNKEITRLSRFHRFINPSQHRGIYKSRDRAVSRIPAMQLKHTLQKSRKVRKSVRKLTLKLVPKSSKLHQYLSRKSHVYHRLTYDLCGITLKHKQFKESVKYTSCSFSGFI